LDDTGTGAASVQVLQELYVTLTRTLRPVLTPEEARTIVRDLLTWQIVVPGPADVLTAIEESGRWQVSFWDAMLLVTANKAGASVLWTEELNDGQAYGAVTARNPFR
jgi:predicted nucleic acid-binding protein